MTRGSKLGLVGLLAALCGGGAALYRHMHCAPVMLVDAIPTDAFAAVDVNLDALRRSGALSAVFGNGQEQTVTKVCGFDPVDRMHELLFAFPEKGDGDFGVVVSADLTRDELLGCSRKLIEARGGEAPKATESRGSFAIVSQPGSPDQKSRPALAFRDGGPYIIGVGEWLGRLVDSVDHPPPGGVHAALRGGLAGDSHPAFVLTATVVLLKNLREKLKVQMATKTEDEADGASSTMAGILGVSSAALGLYEQGDQMRAVADLVCDDAAACTTVQKFIWRKQEVLRKDPTLRVFGVAAVIDRLEVDSHDTHLQIRASAPTKQVVDWVKAFVPAAASPP